MGWFALPIEAPDLETNFLAGEPETQNLTISQRQQLDRQWEILSINVPDLSIHGSYEGTYKQVGGGSLEHLGVADVQAAWNPEISIAISYQILQSGIVVGALPFSQVLKPFAKVITVAENRFNFEFDLLSVSLADSLQNPIIISGAEKIQARITYSIALALLPNFTYEFEEAGKTVRKEIEPEIQALHMQWSYNRFFPPHKGPAMVLYINESDREYAPVEGDIRPADVPV